MTVPANGAPQEGAEGTTGAGQAPPGQPDPAEGLEPTGTPDGTPDPSKIEDPVLRAYVETQVKQAAEARREAAKYRTERNALQTAQEAARLAALPTEEQALEAGRLRDAENAALKSELADLRVGGTIRNAATEAKAHNPETILAMIRDQVETDDKGNPTNVAALLTALRKSDGYLFRRTNVADAGAGNGKGEGTRPSQSMNDAIRAAAGRGPSPT